MISNRNYEVRQKNQNKKKLFTLKIPRGTDEWIHICMIWLSIFGLLMISSASMGQAINNSSYLFTIIIKQIVYILIGFIAMYFLIVNFKLEILKNSNFPVYAIIMACILFSCIFFRGTSGAKAWIRLPMNISIQPSEFAKIMSFLVVAAYLGDIKKTFSNTKEMIKKPFIIIGTYLFIVLFLQSDLGSMAVILMICWVCIFIPRHPQLRLLQIIFIIITILGGMIAMYLLSPYGDALIRKLPLRQYQINRIISAVNPFVDQYGTGYQLVNGLVSFATGGWRGLGFGNSIRKYTNFPAANTDFILAILVEEFGYIGFLLVFIPYLIIIFRLFHYTKKMKSERARIVMIGTIMYIAVHALFNIGGVTGMIPLTGVPLLMISAGGSSTISLLCCIGISQAVIQQFRKGEIQ